eukprot:15443968-Alexandrium_andersonii.AAC.1
MPRDPAPADTLPHGGAPREPALLQSPTYDLQSSAEEQSRSVAAHLAKVARTVNTLQGRQS